MVKEAVTCVADDAQSPDIKTAEAPARMELARVLPTHRVFAVSKTLLLVVLGMFLAHGHFSGDVGLTMLLAGLLWASLYALNEYFDLRIENGLVGSRGLAVTLILLPVAICAASMLVHRHLPLLLGLMTIGQIFYCAPPFRLKRYWWVVLVLSGLLNPALRLLCGAIWGVAPIPWLAFIALEALHFGSMIRTRMLQKKRDHGYGYSTIPPFMHWVGIASMAAGLIASLAVCLLGLLPRSFSFFVLIGAGYTIYSWSRVSSIEHVRKGWLRFALLAVVALIILLFMRS